MTLEVKYTTVAVTMSLISIIVCIVILLLSTVKSTPKEPTPIAAPSVQNFKEFVSNMIKEQSSKIQILLKKIQTNAQSVLEKIEGMKQDSKSNGYQKNYADTFRRYLKLERQVEAPLEKNYIEATTELNPEARSFNNYAATTGYGASGNANYGSSHVQAFHHHSIGFDPINIVVSVSLLSFLLQAIQGLLSRTRLPTPVTEARNFKYDPVQNWLKKLNEKPIFKANYAKSKYPKKYYR